MIERRYPRRVLVKDFQLRFVWINLLFLCLAWAAFSLLLFGPLVLRLFDPSATFEEQTGAATAFLALHARVWLGIALVLVLSVVHLAIVSHRVAGPLVRFNRIFQDVRHGDVSMRVRIRARDYLQEEATAFDRMVSALRRRLHVAKHRAARLDATLEDLSARIGPGSATDIGCTVQSVRRQTYLLRQSLERFRTVRAPEQPKGALHADGASDPEEHGFSLIELCLVGAIVTTLAALAVPVYVHALDRAKAVRAAGEIRAIAMDIKRWEVINGALPNTLVEAGITSLVDPYGSPYQYLRIDGGAAGKGSVRKDHKLNPINADFDLYSNGKDTVSQLQITQKDSLDDIIRANDGGFVGVASDF